MFKWGETKLHFCSVLLLLCKFSHKLHGWARWEHLHFSCFLFSSAEQFLNYSVDCEIVCTDTLCHARAWNSLNSPLSSPLWPASSQYGQFSTFFPHHTLPVSHPTFVFYFSCCWINHNKVLSKSDCIIQQFTQTELISCCAQSFVFSMVQLLCCHWSFPLAQTLNCLFVFFISHSKCKIKLK